MELRKEFKFEASHILPKHPGKCSRLHGHSWVLEVSVKGIINPDTGFVMDYADISKIVKPMVEALDHKHLGTWGGILNESWGVNAIGWDVDIYPSSENLLMWIGKHLRFLGLDWSKVALKETCTSYCELTREEFR